MLKWAHYARKLDNGLLCPNIEIRPRTPKNGIFQNFFVFEFEGKRKDTSLVITRSFQYFCEHRRQLKNEMIK